MWTFAGKEFFEEEVERFGNPVGFVYIITNIKNGRQYIGQKKFGAKRKITRAGKSKRVYKKSDWMEYYGSNEELKEDVKKEGKDNFARQIIRLCYSKAEMNYYELYEQMAHHVILQPRAYYNAYVGGRISRRQLTSHLI